MNSIKYAIFLLYFMVPLTGFSQYYKTLPKGVGMFSFNNYRSEISSSYNKSQSETPYAVKIEATVENLSLIDNSVVQEALDLFKPYPEAYEKLSLGTHYIDGEAEVNVDVYAMAYGISDKVTAYIGIPLYDAKVKVHYERTDSSSNKEVAEALQKQYGDDWAQTLGNIVDKMFDVDGSIIQSALVNSLGYDELGTWSAKGPGDVELGIMYNFIKDKKYGLKTTIGAVAPTGYVDDPDLIQDIGFGDGQWDAFLEFGGGYRISSILSFNAWGRYTHQFANEKTLRVPYSKDIPLSNEKKKFREKLGNKILINVNAVIEFTDWFKITPGYSIEHIEKAEYFSNNQQANDSLAKDTESYSQSYQISAQLTSVSSYLKQEFLIPAELGYTYKSMVEGKNTAKVELHGMELRLFF